MNAMTLEEKMTAPNSSVGADTEQSGNNTNTIITDTNDNFNICDESFHRMQMNFLRELDSSYIKTVSMSELYERVFYSNPPIIHGLLYSGTYLFVGAPKLGKSFFMAQLAYHVSTGTPLWNYPVRKGTVLYLALEDDYRRLQSRLYRMFGTESTDRLFFAVSSHQLGKGLTEHLSGFIAEHKDTALIIIDTLQKVREASGESFSYGNDYDIISQLKKFADANKICLLLVHHTRKQKSDDNFDMISGTNGLLGAADGAFLLHKEKRTSDKAVLEISGRDQQDQKLHVVRNRETLAWELEKAETELWKSPPEPILEKVAKFININNPEWQGSPTELVSVLGIDIKPNTLTLKLNVNSGKLYNEYGIRYESKRTHSGRFVRFLLENKNSRDDA